MLSRIRRVLPLVTVALLGLAGCASSPAAAPRWQPPVPSTSPSPSPSPTPTRTPNPFDGKLPTFPAAPVAEKVPLTGGPSAPLYSRIPTTQKVAFLTIDDGWIRRPEALQLLRSAGIPVTLFLLGPAAKEDPHYFQQLTGQGAMIEGHTINHKSLPSLGYDGQKYEICGGNDQLAATFGKRPTLFRPPFGEYNQTTLKAAHDCGMKAVFYWTQTIDKGVVRYQGPPGQMKPGDIILMHFREAYVADFTAALTAMKANGLTPALLEDYIP